MVPPEISDRIISLVPDEDHDTISACSRVCWAWLHARSRLFRQLRFGGYYSQSARSRKLAAVLRTSPHLGRYFRDVDLAFSTHRSRKPERTISRIHTEILPFLTQASCVSLGKPALALPREPLQRLLRSSTLVRLLLWHAEFRTQNDFLDVITLCRSLTHLELHGTMCRAETPGWESAMAPTDIAVIKLQYLEIVGWYSHPIILAVFLSHASPFDLGHLRGLMVLSMDWPLHSLLARASPVLDHIAFRADTTTGACTITSSVYSLAEP